MRRVVAVVGLLSVLACETLLDDSIWTIELSPNAVRLTPGDELAFEAVARSDDGREVPATDLSWNSSAPDIASVSGAGRVQGLALGLATIKASYKGAQTSAEITVVEAPDDCSARPATMHAGSEVSATWRRADGPHVLIDDVSVEELAVERGTLICGDSGAALDVNELRGGGLFTAVDPEAGWGGISADIVDLNDARIEYADAGLSAGRVELRDVVIRQSRGRALSVSEIIILQHVRVDTACTDSCFAAVVVNDDLRPSLNSVTVRGSGGDGIWVNRFACPTLNDVTIEGNAGVGLILERVHYGSECVNVSGRLRLTGNGYPARVAPADVAQLFPTAAAYEDALGNRADTLLIVAANNSGGGVVSPMMPWRLVFDGFAGPITLEPGATLVGTPPSNDELNVPSLHVSGTAEFPATLSGLRVYAQRYEIRHARLEGGVTLGRCAPGSNHCGGNLLDTATMELEDVVLDSAGVTLRRGSHVSRLRFMDAASLMSDSALVVIAGDSVTVDSCDISGFSGDAIRVLSGVGVRISGCNLHGNAGLGVNNLGAHEVDATGIWWGDAEGPHGPQGDGVSGNVLYIPFLTAPASNGG